MSTTWLAEYERDPAKAVRKQLEALWKVDADRCAFIRQQRAGASTVSSTPKPHHSASDLSGAPNNPETPNAA